MATHSLFRVCFVALVFIVLPYSHAAKNDTRLSFGVSGLNSHAFAQRFFIPAFHLTGHLLPNGVLSSTLPQYKPVAGQIVVRQVGRLDVHSAGVGWTSQAFEKHLLEYLDKLSNWVLNGGHPPQYKPYRPNPKNIYSIEKASISNVFSPQQQHTGAFTYWEIGNEPNLWPYISPESYAHLFEIYFNSLKRQSPEAKVVLGPFYDFSLSPGLHDVFRQQFQRHISLLMKKHLSSNYHLIHLMGGLEKIMEKASSQIIDPLFQHQTHEYIDIVLRSLGELRPDVISIHTFPLGGGGYGSQVKAIPKLFKNSESLLRDVLKKYSMESLPVWVTGFGCFQPKYNDAQSAKITSALLGAFKKSPTIKRWFIFQPDSYLHPYHVYGWPARSFGAITKEPGDAPENGKFACAQLNQTGRVYFAHAKGEACQESLNFEKPTWVVTESGRGDSLRLMLSHPVPNTVKGAFLIQGPKAYPWYEVFSVSPKQFKIKPGTTSLPLVIKPKNDSVWTGNRSYTIRFKALTNAASGSDSLLTLVIVDDDSPPAPALVVRQPSDATINEYATASFSVVASGNRLKYQWLKDGIPIPGAGKPEWVVPNVSWLDSASGFKCIVSNDMGADTSSVAKLHVTMAAPKIIKQPDTVILAAEGHAATIGLEAKGSQLVFEWLSNTKPLPESNSPSLHIPSVTAEMDGRTYQCVIRNAAGRLRSRRVRLQVANKPPAIQVHPSDQSVTNGETAVFKVIAHGRSLSYEWQSDGHVVADITGPTLKIENITQADSGRLVRCIVSGSGGADTSRWAMLSVAFYAPSILQHPLSQTVTEGDTVRFHVKAKGEGLKYKWLLNGAASTASTGPVYVYANAQLPENGLKISCVVSNGGGSSMSRNAVLTIKPRPPEILAQPNNQHVKTGDLAVFLIKARGNGLRFQWYRNDNPIEGAELSEYQIHADISRDNGARFKCVVSNGSASVTSQTALLKVAKSPPPVITLQPKSDTVVLGKPFQIKISASGPKLNFQWQRDSADINGATQSTYVLPVVAASDAGARFRCVVSNEGGVLLSDWATVSVLYPPPVIDIPPLDAYVVMGETAHFKVKASGRDLQYQWQMNGADIPGANQPILSLDNILRKMDRSKIRCIVSNSGGRVVSRASELQVVQTTPKKPALVQPVAGQGIGAVRPQFKWRAVDADRYEFNLAKDSLFSQLVLNNPDLKDTVYHATPLSFETRYFWKVRGINQTGIGKWSDIGSFQTGYTPPGAPQMTAPVSGTDNLPLQPVMLWQPVENALNYQIQVASDDEFGDIVFENFEIKSTNTVVSGLKKDSRYFWRIRSESNGGPGEWSKAWVFKTMPKPPQIAHLMAPPDGAKRVSVTPLLTWTPIEGAKFYRLQISSDPQFEKMTVDRQDISNTAWIIQQKLKKQTTFYWRIATINFGGQGEWSKSYVFTTIPNIPDVPMPTYPANGVTLVDNEVQFKWKPDEYADYFRIQIASDSKFKNILIAPDSIRGDNTALTLPQKAGKYYWRLMAGNTSGESQWSRYAELALEDKVAIFKVGKRIPRKLEISSPVNRKEKLMFRVAIPSKTHVKLDIFKPSGGRGIVLTNNHLEPGYYNIKYKGKLETSGEYVYRLITALGVKNGRVTINN